ncbi:sunset domain-containing protein [Pseudonocardia parietis]|uniref:Uncharacterized protein n=1 Tax=Pseudonocardia parietis TaxID=570936 RepID=A0ABS4VPK7_9PSEU|nr:hypothetical protein [Pseudonocardia parietis]MBP2365711.1 hypothetical protein [Pseudonocardia parietis]
MPGGIAAGAAAPARGTATDERGTVTGGSAADSGTEPVDRAAATEAPDSTGRSTGAAPDAPAIPEQPGHDDDPSGPGRHALHEGVDPGPLPEVDLPEQGGPLEPLTAQTGSRGTSAPTGGSALAALDARLLGPTATPWDTGPRPGPYRGSVLAPTDGSEPPETHRVKVHSGSRRFHTLESPYYVRTRADLYFTGEQEARGAGFIAWYERPGAR